jgi:hypothetical protein
MNSTPLVSLRVYVWYAGLHLKKRNIPPVNVNGSEHTERQARSLKAVSPAAFTWYVIQSPTMLDVHMGRAVKRR